MAGRSKIVIGLDFGTTYSGIAWSLHNGTGGIEVLSTWPGGGNRTTPKVPTTIKYDGDTQRWGYETSSLENVIRGVKLLLDESQEVKYQPASEARAMIASQGKSPVEVASDYLQRLVDHTQTILRRRFGTAVQDMRYHYILAIPAVWSDKAKDLTLRAAMDAGIETGISTISEPEAAALYCLTVIQPNSIESGDVILVCDAGGGTVTKSPIRLEEATEGTGSVILDERFRDLMRETLGSTTYDAIPQKSKNVTIKYWEENIKPSFTSALGDDDDDDDEFLDMDYFIPLPGVSSDVQAVSNGFLQLSGHAIKKIFDPVINDIEKLVQSQVDSLSEARMMPKVTPKAPMNPLIGRPSYVQRGLDGNQVMERIARRNYGVTYKITSSSQLSSDSYWADLEELC
ncbi:hypothetical protein FE257_010333 [Aspergillus nanangensis]|uniref:Actin-like ATPase domain-containing protein n=1 Tax=Aspergillus nanangensis TaxID=2582783 RepID=A0AAD4GTE0_ASPNN|nr:hypothetical protein FE257_010333 [Aspergillus nanangensis]